MFPTMYSALYFFGVVVRCSLLIAKMVFTSDSFSEVPIG